MQEDQGLVSALEPAESGRRQRRRQEGLHEVGAGLHPLQQRQARPARRVLGNG